MALVVLLRGVNVGGHRTLRPAALAQQLKHLDIVNVGAAGTFVVRRPIARAELRAEFAKRLPFETQMMICDGRDIARMIARDHFADLPVQRDLVPFVSVLAKRPRSAPVTPIVFPPKGDWLLKVLARDHQFIFGVYRRQMKAIGHLGSLDKLFGSPATTRNWNTIAAIAEALQKGGTRKNSQRSPRGHGTGESARRRGRSSPGCR